jgi:hypothetical protein
VIRINSQPCKGNNLTTQHSRATKANEWPPFAMTIKESGRVLPHLSAIFHVKSLTSSPWVARTLSYRPTRQPSSYLVSGGISAHMRQYTNQMLVNL